MSDQKDQEIRHKDADLEIEEIIKDFMDDGEGKKATPAKPKSAKKPSEGASFSDFVSKLKKKISGNKSTKDKISKEKTAKSKTETMPKVQSSTSGKPHREGMSAKKSAEYKRINQVPKTGTKSEASEAKTGVFRKNVFAFMDNEKIRGYVIFSTKIILAIVILIFVVMMFRPWFTVTGTGAERGIIRIEENMVPDDNNQMFLHNEEEVLTRVADFSPMSLVGYALNYRDTYQMFIDNEGTEGTSTIARLHLFYIWLLIVVIGAAVISIMLLVIGKNYQFLHIVRSVGMMSACVVALNFISLKIPFFSMLAVRVQSILNVEYPSEVARLTQNGIVSGDVSYSYGLELLEPFKMVVILLVIWIVLGAILGEIKNKMDDYERMNEV